MDAALALDPLIGAIAAGNTVLLKPSELAPECASVLQEIVPIYLDCNAIKVINGGADVGEKLLQQKWDKIFFTGIDDFPNLQFMNLTHYVHSHRWNMCYAQTTISSNNH